MNLIKVGEIKTPYEKLDDCPSNVSKNGAPCTLVLQEEFEEALLGLKQGQKILVLYWFDQAKRDVLTQSNVHKADGEVVGTFALRSPYRPNPIAASEVYIERIEKNHVFVNGLDCLNETALLDIKPA